MQIIVKRILAFVYDAFIAASLLMIGTYALLPFTHGQAIPSGTYWYQAYLLLLLFIYWGGFWYWRQQTIGMIAWKIKIISLDNNYLKFWQIVVRFFCGLIFFLFGLLFCFFSKKKQAFYDLLAKTTIVSSA